MEGAKTAPVDAAGSCHLAGTVYSCEILPLPAKRHPRQQRDHLQRPAQIAEIMHFRRARPGLSGRAAIRTVMHAVGPTARAVRAWGFRRVAPQHLMDVMVEAAIETWERDGVRFRHELHASCTQSATTQLVLHHWLILR